ncbi:hypothetical protein [Mycoavidus cysteinexigens]|uniref:hypothetical protein n=1 Tax=Mycoavidus cysteinexigens TaxID=1553431 RepID=UPI000345F29E|nr:hypothetical protein [Mycoavidus cysteinexigens]GAM52369.1 hypothetical protein EBME_0832 [bacterium endosymbiont of Mortierella elongata FMR23-6]
MIKDEIGFYSSQLATLSDINHARPALGGDFQKIFVVLFCLELVEERLAPVADERVRYGS